jgi:hypothetical protein
MNAEGKVEFATRYMGNTARLSTLCVCGCPMGVHYFKIIPGAPRCSTCDSCRLFVPAKQEILPEKEAAHV